MILNGAFEQCVPDPPLSLMAPGVLKDALSPKVADPLLEDGAEKQSTRKLLFSKIVDLTSSVVCRIRPALHAASQADAETIKVAPRAVSDKLGSRAEPRSNTSPP